MALTLNGTSEYLENDGIAAITAVDCSLRAKWRPATVATQSSLLGFYASGALNPIIRVGRTSAGVTHAVFRNDAGGSSAGVGTTTLSTVTPQIVGANFGADGAASAVYNGTVEHTAAAPASTTVTLDRTVMGRRHASATSDNFSDGDIYWGAGWNRVLTAAEDAMLQAGLSPLFIPRGLVYYEEYINRENFPGVGPVMTRTGGAFITHGALIYPGRSTIQVKIPATSRTLTGANTIAAFASTAAAKVLAQLAGTDTLAAFSSVGALGSGAANLTAAQVIAAFQSAGAAAALAQLRGTSMIPAFTSAAAAAVLAELAGASAMGAFVSQAHVGLVQRLVGTQLIANFATSGILQNPDAPPTGGMYPWARRRRGR